MNKNSKKMNRRDALKTMGCIVATTALSSTGLTSLAATTENGLSSREFQHDG